jgi:hypothetical protein
MFSKGDLIMRKVLLATTALVGMGVTAAHADISISGYQNFEVSDNASATSWAIDGDVKIVSTNTTDAGLTLTAAHHINTSSSTKTTPAAGADLTLNSHVDDSYLDISGEFGSVRLGNTDDALDRMDGAYPANWDENGSASSDAAAGSFAIGGTQPAVTASFISPSVSGATFYASSTAEGDYTGMGVNYSAGPVTVVYQSGTSGTTDSSLLAANVSFSGVTIGFGAGDKDAAGTKTEYASMGVKYAVSDAIDLYALSQKQKGSSQATSIGGYFQVAPGLQIAAEQHSDENDDQTTYAHLKVSF